MSRWSGYHFKQTPQRPMEIMRVEILHPVNGRQKFKPLWLAWLGETMPPLETLWLSYWRCFALEHWYRFAKQRLWWTQPQFSTVQATERWSALMPLLTCQLWRVSHGYLFASLEERLCVIPAVRVGAVLWARSARPQHGPQHDDYRYNAYGLRR